MRLYIIDGHNVLFRENRLNLNFSNDPARAMNRLILRCQRLVSGKNISCRIIFDGNPPGDIITTVAGVRITFSYENSADALIKSLIARSANPRNLIVVSDDVEIQKYARVNSCKILSVPNFLSVLSDSSELNETEKPTSDDTSIEEWLRLFKK